MFDGAMARVQNAATSFGAFLDSVLDRYSESIIPALLARPERVVILAIGLLSHTGI